MDIAAPPHPPEDTPADAPKDADERESGDLIDRYWEELRRGDTPRPRDWLEAHASDSPQLLGQLEVMEMIHRSRSRREEAGAHPDSPTSSSRSPDVSKTPQPALKDTITLGGGEFCILGWHDAGGMGEVYRAWQNGLDVEVIIKLTQDPTLKARFRRERAIHGRLKGHKHITVARGAGQHEGRDYLVMDYIPGVNLQEFVEANGPLPWREASAMICQAAEGLAHAHAMNIVHRDIKPNNLMRSDEDQSIKILDWGLARCMDPASSRDDDRTSTGYFLGNPHYISPEQRFNPSTVGPAGDIFSLGCTFYFLLTGYPPGAMGPDQEQVSAAIPTEVRHVVRKMLRRRPEDRYRSAREVIEALDAVLRERPVIGPIDPPPWRWGRVAAVPLLVAGTVGMGWFLTERLTSPTRPIDAKAPTWQPQAPAGPINGPQSKPYAAPPLEYLTITFERFPPGAREPLHEKLEIVKNGRRLEVGSTGPLVMNEAGKNEPDRKNWRQESFWIKGSFRKPADWYVAWFDTRGVIEVSAGAPNRRTALLYPVASRSGMYPDYADPLGTHMILVVAGELPLNQARAQLEELLGRIGKPPDLKRGDPWSYRLSDDEDQGETTEPNRSPQSRPLQVPDQERELRAYLAEVQSRLHGSSFQAVHAFFISTQR